MQPLLNAICICSALLWALTGSVQAADGTVKLTKKGSEIEVTIDGKEFTVYHTDKSVRKPFFWPVRAADGTILNRGLEATKEHPHHKGIWFGVEKVNISKENPEGYNYWSEKSAVENVSAEITKAEGNPATMRIVNHWVDDKGKPVVIETTDVSIFANRLLAYDAKLTSGGDQPATFGDTKEGLFAFRMADPLRGKVEPGKGYTAGRIQNAEGKKGEKEAWGLESKWVDYDGEIQGKTYGVAIFDNPGNFRRSRYHVRDYGLFAVSPFGQSAYTNGKIPADTYTLEQGKTLRLRYGVYIHDGDTAAGHVPEAYEYYLKHTSN